MVVGWARIDCENFHTVAPHLRGFKHTLQRDGVFSRLRLIRFIPSPHSEGVVFTSFFCIALHQVFLAVTVVTALGAFHG